MIKIFTLDLILSDPNSGVGLKALKLKNVLIYKRREYFLKNHLWQPSQ